MADNDFDPAGTLGADDPLRAWQQQLNDPALGMLMVTDPQKAVEVMAQRGIAPPPTAQSFTSSNEGGADDSQINAPIRINPDGTIAGNITAPTDPDKPPVPQGGTPGDRRPIFQRIHDYLSPEPAMAASPGAAPASVTKPDAGANVAAATPAPSPIKPTPAPTSSAGSDLDPAEDEPTAPEPKKDKAAGADKTAKALSGFSESFKGVKAPPLPPLNAVGTPSAPHPNAIATPGIQQLLALAGQAAPGSALGTLGRLLVQGKA